MNSSKDSLHSEHTHVPWWQIDFGDESRIEVLRSIDSRSFSMGPAIERMEERFAHYLNVRNCVAVSNGTSALLIALLALNIEPGDEIIIQDRTWIAAANAAQVLGATVKMADVCVPPNFNSKLASPPLACIDEIEKLVSLKTKAIIISHMNGRAPNSNAIQRLKNFNIPVIEDAAQALGSQDSNGTFLGTLFTAGCFSLAMTKLVSAGQGGFVVTNDDHLAQKLKMSRTQGVEQVFEANWATRGLNLRMTDLHGSIALSQIDKMTRIFNRQNEVVKVYSENLKKNPEISMVGRGHGLIEIGPYVECVVQNRKSLLNWLKKNGVEARPFYPNIASARHINPLGLETPNSRLWGNHGIYLPSGPGISDDEIRTVCHLINRFFN